MAEYGVIYKTLWRKERFYSMSDDGQKLVLYFFSAPDSNMIGIWYYYKYSILGELAFQNWSPERFNKAFNEAISRGWISYDENARVLFVNYWFDHHPLNENQLQKAIGQVPGLPRSPLFKYAIEQLDSKDCKLKKGYRERLGESFRERFENGSRTVTETVREGLPQGLPERFEKDKPPLTITITGTNTNIGGPAQNESLPENIAAKPPLPKNPEPEKETKPANRIDEVIELIKRLWPNSKLQRVMPSGINKLLTAGFGTYDALICCIETIKPPKEDAYGWLMHIARDPESVAKYIKMAESKPISQTNGIDYGTLLKDVNDDTTSS